MGSITWKFVKQLKDDTNINEYEAKYITLPIDLREVIAEYNGARPNKKIFDTLNTKERVFNSLISFRKEDKMNIFFVMEYLAKDFPENLYPFGVDPFGNYICILNNASKEVVFYDNDTNIIEKICNTFTEFCEMLREE